MNQRRASAPRIGLTGGIGSGKSTVAALLASAGAAILDADALSRESTASGGAAIPLIAEAFGPEFLDGDGALDRARMRSLVFADPSARARLEAIVHPLVLRGIAERTDTALQAGARLLVLDIPLLVESGRWAPALDAVLVVDCRTETQIERVMRRSGMPRAQVQSILDTQASRAQRRAVADAVLFNDGISLAALDDAVRTFARGFGL
ncbi:MAG: dephospho-CoA kinase [Burkholderiales bacterium]|nr:dephospho-CoA kinase [Burkholderiales bacterium]